MCKERRAIIGFGKWEDSTYDLDKLNVKKKELKVRNMNEWRNNDEGRMNNDEGIRMNKGMMMKEEWIKEYEWMWVL